MRGLRVTGEMQKFKRDWVIILVAGVLGYTAANAIKSGEITPAVYKKYTRTESPIRFWIATFVYIVIAITCLVALFVP